MQVVAAVDVVTSHSLVALRRIPDLKDPAQQAEWRRCQTLVEKEAALVRSMARGGRGMLSAGAGATMPCHRSRDTASRDAGSEPRSFPLATVGVCLAQPDPAMSSW